MEKRIENITKALIEAIRSSQAYRDYQWSRSMLETEPGVLDEISRMRRATMENYEHGSQEELVELSDRLNETYQDLLKNPAVHVYLESETELIRSLQTISDEVLSSVDLYVPDGE